MTALLTALLLLMPAPDAEKVPELKELLTQRNTDAALTLLKEIGALKGNDAEAKALLKLIRARKPKKPPEVLEASFMALQGIGSKKVTKHLLLLLDHRMAKDPAVRIGICRALQGSVDKAASKDLTKLLRDKEDTVAAAAASAIGAYRYAPEATRKDLFKVVMNILDSTWNVKNSVKPDLKVERRRAQKKWAIIAKPFEKTLELLSNTRQRHPAEWRKWWNKNKRKKWGNAPQ
ncbi:MAG: hypothetical protein ACE10D_04990 [Planctomycetota bacterium]|nr:hypothetical protein [Planctomycetota bacterium]